MPSQSQLTNDVFGVGEKSMSLTQRAWLFLHSAVDWVGSIASFLYTCNNQGNTVNCRQTMFFPGNYCTNPHLPKPQIKQLMYSIQATQTHCDLRIYHWYFLVDPMIPKTSHSPTCGKYIFTNHNLLHSGQVNEFLLCRSPPVMRFLDLKDTSTDMAFDWIFEKFKLI